MQPPCGNIIGTPMRFKSYDISTWDAAHMKVSPIHPVMFFSINYLTNPESNQGSNTLLSCHVLLVSAPKNDLAALSSPPFIDATSKSRLAALCLMEGPPLFERGTALEEGFTVSISACLPPFCLQLWDFSKHPMHGQFNSDSPVKNGFETPISSLHTVFIRCGCQRQG